MTSPNSRTAELRRPLAISIAAILFALIAVPIGLADPSNAGTPRGNGESADQLQLARADARAGFPVPHHPDVTPRGPAA